MSLIFLSLIWYVGVSKAGFFVFLVLIQEHYWGDSIDSLKKSIHEKIVAQFNVLVCKFQILTECWDLPTLSGCGVFKCA